MPSTRPSLAALRHVTSAALAFILAAPPAAGAKSLCGATETTIVACRTAVHRRVAALCADEGKTPWALTYRFGKPGQVDLTYPAPGEPAAFRHAIISYSALGGDAVLFTQAGATYALFTVLGHDTAFTGVSVRRGETEIANLSCAENSVDKLTTDFFAGAGLPRESGQFDVPEVFFTRYDARRKVRR